jgi:hypothetical protein
MQGLVLAGRAPVLDHGLGAISDAGGFRGILNDNFDLDICWSY